jgi:thiol-disulfide isomerase/thioredoxin
MIGRFVLQMGSFALITGLSPFAFSAPAVVGQTVIYDVTTTRTVREAEGNPPRSNTSEMRAETSVTLLNETDTGTRTFLGFSTVSEPDAPQQVTMENLTLFDQSKEGEINVRMSLGPDVGLSNVLGFLAQGQSLVKDRNSRGALGVLIPELQLRVFFDLTDGEETATGSRLRVIKAPAENVRSGPFSVVVLAGRGQMEVGAGSDFVTSATVQLAVKADAPENQSVVAGTEFTAQFVREGSRMGNAEAANILAELESADRVRAALESINPTEDPEGPQKAVKELKAHLEKFPKGLLSEQMRGAVEQIEFMSEMAKRQSALRPMAPAPEVSATTVNGEKFSLADFKGKYVLLDFWASWCAPCAEEMPAVIEAAKKFENNLVVIGISTDNTLEELVEFTKAKGMEWMQVHEPNFGGAFYRAFAVTAIPHMVLIDRQGRLVDAGFRSSQIEEKLRELIAAE